MNSLVKCILIYLNPQVVCVRKNIAITPPPQWLSSEFLNQADGIVLYFELENICSMATIIILLYLILIMVITL